MSEGDSCAAPSSFPRPGLPGRGIALLARLFAILAGLIICALSLVTVYGIVTRELASLAVRFHLSWLSWIRPLSGDFEIVELGCGIAIAASLPYCQLVGGHIAVDLFTQRLSTRARTVLGLLGDLLLALVASLLAWRSFLGALDVAAYHDTTMVLRIPVVWAYLPVAVSLGLLALVALYTASRHLRALGDGW